MSSGELSYGFLGERISGIDTVAGRPSGDNRRQRSMATGTEHNKDKALADCKPGGRDQPLEGRRSLRGHRSTRSGEMFRIIPEIRHRRGSGDPRTNRMPPPSAPTQRAAVPCLSVPIDPANVLIDNPG